MSNLLLSVIGAFAELDFAHFSGLRERALALGPEDVFGSDELECSIDGKFGRPKWAASDPSFLPQRPVENVEAAFCVGRSQAGDRSAGSGIE